MAEDTKVRNPFAPAQTELKKVEENLRLLPLAGLGPLPPLLNHVIDTHGKLLRPAITVLASKFHPNDGSLPILMATAAELLHIATLIHDDTVDNSNVRRGKATVSSLWGRNVAVLLGDYLFATSATFVCDTKNVRVIRRFSETIMELSSGELAELMEGYESKQGRESYLRRIYLKTASLFCTASESGAILSGAPEETVKALRDYGYNLGMAYQIVDDILDFEGDPLEVGKPVGSDLRQGVVTLPAILLRERHPDDNPVEQFFHGIEPETSLKRAVAMIQGSGIIQECYEVAAAYCAKAARSLEGLPDNPARCSLQELAQYAMERRR